MSVSVPLPRTAMLVCSSLQTNSRHHWLEERWEGEERNIGAPCVAGVGDFFPSALFSSSTTADCYHIDDGLVSGRVVYTQEPLDRLALFPVASGLLAPQCSCSSSKPSMSHPSLILPSGLYPCPHQGLGEILRFYIFLLIWGCVVKNPQSQRLTLKEHNQYSFG